MSLTRRTAARRSSIAALVIALLAATVALPALSATASVSGTLTFKQQPTLGGGAVAVVTLVDLAAAPDAGAIVGEQRIDGVTVTPLPFSVPYDPARIDAKRAYGLFATLVSGSSSWQNPQGIPVITGGPSSGVAVPLTAVGPTAATLSGTITKSDKSALGPGAVAIAALIKQQTGTLVARQVIVAPGQSPVAFSVGFDPTLIDPAATYVMKAAIVDGSQAWENRAGVTAIQAGTPVGTISVPVVAAPAPLPVVSPIPTAAPTAAPTATPKPSPSPTPKPTAKPTPKPTAKPTPKPTPSPSPTPTPSPSPTPTASPTPSPSPTPTASPTPSPTPTASLTPSPSPTASPTPSPSPTPSATPSPSPTPAAPTATPVNGALTGTLDYAEPHQLSPDAVAVVVLVAGTAKPDEGSIVATQIIRQPGATPIAFRLVYETAAIDPNVTYTVQAGIVDSTAAWATAKGTKVITNGAPTSDLALVLAFRPDLVKGAVTGTITGVGVTASAQAYSVAVLVNPASGESLGLDMNPVGTGLPAAFSIPFSLDTIDPAADYVVTGEVVDGAQTWENAAGVPVITKGNPIADVQVVVTPVVAPSPSPGPGATGETGPGDSGPALLLIVIALIVGGIGFYLWSRSRSTPPPAPAAGPATEPGAEATSEPAAEPAAEATTEPAAEEPAEAAGEATDAPTTDVPGEPPPEPADEASVEPPAETPVEPPPVGEPPGEQPAG